MKALTLHQPWASLVVLDAKKFESRSWSTNYHGWLAIHSSQETQFLDANFLVQLEKRAGYLPGELTGLTYPTGAIIGAVQLWGCRRVEDLKPIYGFTKKERALGDYSPGRYAWLLGIAISFVTIYPMRGKQKIWTVPPEIEQKILLQVRGPAC